MDNAGAAGRILVVEDDTPTRELVTMGLQRDGYEVRGSGRGDGVVAAILEWSADLVVLDVGLPDANGFDILRAIRRRSDVPVILVTGRDGEADRLLGLELGADDYVVKPFFPTELTARVRTVLRRARPAQSITVADRADREAARVRIDTAAREVRVDGALIDTTAKEFDLLAFMSSAPRRVFTREQLLEQVWGSCVEWQHTATVTEHVRRLRQKVEIDPARPELIVTVRGVGYRFEPN
jgi:two-component system phosphate regulon response regulator PhoB